MNQPSNTDVALHHTGSLLERWQISRPTLYNRLKYLGIQLMKGSSNKGYLTDEQVKLMDELDSHIKKTGKMEGFQSSYLVKTDDNNLVEASQEITETHEDIYVEPEQPTEQFDINGLVRDAAELKAREVAMPDLVKRAVADQMTEEDLPEDLKEKVNLAREAANPKFTPWQKLGQNWTGLDFLAPVFFLIFPAYLLFWGEKVPQYQ